MAKKEDDSSSVSSSNSSNSENYSQFLQAFQETHEEDNRLALLDNRLKGMNSWLENKVKTLEEELENSKTDFENLEIVYKSSSCKCDTLICENCENCEKKVHYLVKTMDKLSKGQSNFDNVLASQNCAFRKAGLGFNPQNKQDRFSKSFSKLPEKQPIGLDQTFVLENFLCRKPWRRACNNGTWIVGAPST